MQLKTGAPVPPLNTVDFLGEAVSLDALRGRPVLLSFYRYASCPVCNLRVHSVIESFAPWSAQGLAVIGVFQSPRESISQYVGRQDAPFPIVPDPEMVLYRRFGVESRWGGMASLQVMRSALQAFRKGYLPGAVEGPFHRTPADFLIDAQGRVARAHYGRTIDDHIPLDTITQWLNQQQTG